MRAGFGKSDLTPPLGTELTGYGYYLNRRAESLRDPLYARCVFAETENDRMLLISCELLGLNRHICADVAAYAARYGIKLSDEELISRANTWERRHKGFSGRTAQQFIHYLEGEEA